MHSRSTVEEMVLAALRDQPGTAREVSGRIRGAQFNRNVTEDGAKKALLAFVKRGLVDQRGDVFALAVQA